MTSADPAIRDLTARFTDAVNRRAPGDLAALFTEDGEWRVPGVPIARGRQAIADLLTSLLGNFPRLVQLTHSGHVDADGDRATAVWYITESAVGDADQGYSFIGVYTDALALTAGGWRFERRTFDFLYRGKASFDGRWYPHPRTAG